MFDRCLYFNLNALTRVINRKWADAFEKHDLSAAHGYALRVILGKPGIKPRELAEELRLEKSTITRFIDTLQRKGFVVRKHCNNDGREQNIFPTEKAQKAQAPLEELGESLYQEMISIFGEEELKSLVSLLKDSSRKLN